jgi:broad specificity phosphatase PhoE
VGVLHEGGGAGRQAAGIGGRGSGDVVEPADRSYERVDPARTAGLIARACAGEGDAPLVVLRHSARGAIRSADIAEAVRTPLTEQGRKLARALGGLLPRERSYRLWWSPVPRCRDTAECIAAGLRGGGGTATLAGEQDLLGATYIRAGSDIVREFSARGPRGFVRAWFSGELGGEQIDEPREAGRRLLRELLALRATAQPGGDIDVHVTHDLTLVLLLGLVRDVTDEGFPWPAYLDGVALLPRGARIEWRAGEDVFVSDATGAARPPR